MTESRLSCLLRRALSVSSVWTMIWSWLSDTSAAAPQSSVFFIPSLHLLLVSHTSLSPLSLSLSRLLLPPTSPPSPPLFPSVIICKRTTPSSSASSVEGGLAGDQSEHFKTSCQKTCSSFSFLELWTTTVSSFGSGLWKKKLWSYAFVCDVSGAHGGKLQQGGCCSQAWKWVRPDLTWTVALRLLSEEAHANRVFM